MSTQKRRVTYFYDNDIGSFSYGPAHPMKPFRTRMAHNLIATYGMLDKMQVLRPRRASALQLASFHTDEYVNFLTKVSPETAEELTGGGQRYLLGELDNPAFEGLYEFCTLYAGASLGAAERLNSGAADIAINWAGGLHHAKKREASGFCYVNDIVLCILELLRSYQRVVYIDIDCHHGDGVEEAFYSSDRVLTVSFHKFGEYFPGTGHIDDQGRGPGRGYSVNVPLSDGIGDEPFRDVFDFVMRRVADWYRPGAIVLQCGADSLAGDKLGCLNISMEGHASCVEWVRALGVPFVLLGGGGYTVKNVARTWAYETACAIGVQHELDRDLPYNEFFEWFGPRYRLEVLPSNLEDRNAPEDLLRIKQSIDEQLRSLPFAPSVQMQEVPRDSVGRAAGIDTGTTVRDELESSQDLDAHIADFVNRTKQRRERRLAQHVEQARARGESPLAVFEDHHHVPYPRTNGYGHGPAYLDGMLGSTSQLPLAYRPTSLSQLIEAKLPPSWTGSTSRAPRRFFAGRATEVSDNDDELEDGEDFSDVDETHDVNMWDAAQDEEEQRRRALAQHHAPPIWAHGNGIVLAAA